MALRYLLDENLRGGPLWTAIQQHNSAGIDPIDVTQVGDPPDLPLGTLDPEILLWCEREDRVLVSLDTGTLPVHLSKHLQASHRSPGVFILRRRLSTQVILASL